MYASSVPSKFHIAPVLTAQEMGLSFLPAAQIVSSQYRAKDKMNTTLQFVISTDLALSLLKCCVLVVVNGFLT